LPTTIEQDCQVGRQAIAAALSDHRIPNVDVMQNGNVFTVNGLALTITENGTGIKASATAMNLTSESNEGKRLGARPRLEICEPAFI